MITKLRKIGNSKGVIIPSQFLKECQFDRDVSIRVDNKAVIISNPEQSRSGWSEAFSKSLSRDNDFLIDDTIANGFDEKEWSW